MLRTCLVFIAILLTPVAHANLLFFTIEGQVEQISGPNNDGINLSDSVQVNAIFDEGVFGAASNLYCPGTIQCIAEFDGRDYFEVVSPTGTLSSRNATELPKLIFRGAGELGFIEFNFTEGVNGASATVSSVVDCDANLATFVSNGTTYVVRFQHANASIQRLSLTEPEPGTNENQSLFFYLKSTNHASATILAEVGLGEFAPRQIINGVPQGCANTCIVLFFGSSFFKLQFGEHLFTTLNPSPGLVVPAELYFRPDRSLTQIDMSFAYPNGMEVRTQNDAGVTTATLTRPDGTVAEVAEFVHSDFQPRYLVPRPFGTPSADRCVRPPRPPLLLSEPG